MRRNVGGLDRCVRLMVGCALLALSLLVLGGLRGETWGLVVAAIGIVMLATGLFGFCPLYVPFGISTAREGHWVGHMFARCGWGQGQTGGTLGCCGSKSGEAGSGGGATAHP
jgi:DUF2892 family protein